MVEPIARQWLESQVKDGQKIGLILDGSTVGISATGIPIASTWVGHVRDQSTGATQLELQTYNRNLLPKGFTILLVGDSEFGPVEMLLHLDQWGWDYVLHQQISLHICPAQESELKDFSSMLPNLINAVGWGRACGRRAKFIWSINWCIGLWAKNKLGTWPQRCRIERLH